MAYEWLRQDGAHLIVAGDRVVAQVDMSSWSVRRHAEAVIEGCAWVFDEDGGTLTATPEGSVVPVVRIRLSEPPESRIGARLRSWFRAGPRPSQPEADYELDGSTGSSGGLTVYARGVAVGNLHSSRGLGPALSVVPSVPVPHAVVLMWAGAALHGEAVRAWGVGGGV